MEILGTIVNLIVAAGVLGGLIVLRERLHRSTLKSAPAPVRVVRSRSRVYTVPSERGISGRNRYGE